MKSYIISIITVMLVGMTVILFAFKGTSKPVETKANGTTLIELFTSEGCSSCPAADRTVAELQNTYQDEVLVLCYHVDYWNYLGWKDVFSSAENSARQKYYTGIFKQDGAYTPQAIINGKRECVGSDKGTLLNAIRNGGINNGALQLKATQKVNRVDISYTCSAVNTNEQLILCLVQKQSITKVGNGENGGRTLNHINIVRTFTQVATTKNEAILTIPGGFNKSEYFVAGFVQNINAGVVSIISKAAID